MQQILEPQHLKGPAHFWPCYPKTIGLTLSFLKFVSTCKKWLHSIISFLRYVQFLRPMTRMTRSIFDKVHPKIFQSTVNFIYLYQHTKNQDISSFFSKNIVDFKFLQSGWPRAFWPLYNFLQTWDFYRDRKNNINF